MRATRHNGRSGKNGTYNPKHNDRDFNIENSEHIDAERAKGNVYWDCYQGYCLPDRAREFNFSEIERAFYLEHFGEHIEAQNCRNEAVRHKERNRTVDDVLVLPQLSVNNLFSIHHFCS